MRLSLETRVYKNGTLKVPKTCAKEIIQHKHYRAFMVFLQLKPLYISSVIMNDGGKFPYTLMAHYCGISVSGLRAKIKQLKKYKLLYTDKNKNIHLASYKTFVNIFRPQFLRRMKKYVYKNVASADMLIKISAIQENLRRQEYVVKRKIINKQIFTIDKNTVNAQKDRIKQPEGIFFQVQNDCPRTIYGTDLSKTAIRKIRKTFLKDYDNLLHNQKRLYLENLEHVENGFPEINPYVTLSCAGVGRLFGINASTGHYQRQKLAKANVLSVKEAVTPFLKIMPVSQDGQEELHRQGCNVFSYNYPVKRGIRGMEEKFFMRLPDNLSVNLNFIYENAKN